MSQIIESLNWRYATKKFNASKKVSEKDLDELKEVLRLSASSYGLQPYKFLIIESKDLREKLKKYSWNQSQVTDASHLILISNKINVTPEDIDQHIKNTSNARKIPFENLNGYGNFMKEKLVEKSEIEMKNWTAKQAYIALGQLLSFCAEKRIDSCPLEGFEKDKYDEILDLKSQGFEACVAAAIGYRDQSDANASLAKVRKSKEELIENY